MAETKIRISAQDATQAAFSSVNASLGRLQNTAAAVSTAFASIAGVGFVAALAATVTGTIRLADELNKLSQRTGITVESLSALRNAAELADVSSEEFTTGVRKLNLALTESQEATSKAAQLFKALGVDTRNGAEPALRGIAQAFQALPDGATKAAIATEIFGRAGEKLIPLLNGGAKALDEARAASDRFGTTISTKTAREAEQFNDNLTKLKQSASVLGVSLTSELLPGLTTITDNLVKARVQGNLLGQTFLEINKIYLATIGGVAAALFGEDNAVSRRAEASFRRRMSRDAQAPADQAATGPQLPAGRAPDQAALLRALNPRPAGSSARSGGTTAADLELQQFIKRLQEQEAAQAKFDAAAEKGQQDLLSFYADLAMAQQNRIELAQEEGDRAADALQREADAIKDRLDPTREYIRALERVAELQAQGLLTDREAVAEASRLRDALKGVGDETQRQNDIARDLGLTFSSAFEEAVSGGNSFRNILKGIESDLLKLGTRKLVTEPLFKFFQDTLKGTGESGSGGGFADLFGKAGSFISSLIPKAAGGPVMAGTGYLVGERGPEFFMPQQYGTITPNGGGGGGSTIVFNISTPDASSFRASQSQIYAQAGQALGRAGRRNG